MTTKYYVDGDGKYLGGFDGVEPPDGAVEVATAPENAADTWVNGAWDTSTRPEPAYWEQRKDLYRERLAEYKGVPEASHLDIIGFVLDAQIKAQSGDTAELQDMIAIIAGVKQAVPKPE